MEYVLLKDDDDDVNVAGDEVLKIGSNDETLDINSAKSLQCACMVMLVLDKPSRACHFERTIVKLGNFLKRRPLTEHTAGNIDDRHCSQVQG